jgi:hypothetical protein
LKRDEWLIDICLSQSECWQTHQRLFTKVLPR